VQSNSLRYSDPHARCALSFFIDPHFGKVAMTICEWPNLYLLNSSKLINQHLVLANIVHHQIYNTYIFHEEYITKFKEANIINSNSTAFKQEKYSFV
jgi:hypothetical protein